MNENTNNNITDEKAKPGIPIPISIAIENTKTQLSETINNFVNNIGIPPSVMELILKDLYMQTRELSMGIYQNEKIEYEKTLTESNLEQSD